MEETMFNEHQTKAYIALISSDPKKYYDDHRRMQDAVRHSDAIYKGKPIPMTYQGMFFSPEDFANFETIANILMSIGRKVTAQYVASESYRKWFKFEPRLEALILHDPGYDVPVPVCRYDIFYNSVEDYAFCEFNTDGASAMNQENTLGRILLESAGMVDFAKNHALSNRELFDSWIEASTNIYRRVKGADKKPVVAIVDALDRGTTYEFEAFRRAYEKQGYRCLIADVRELRYEDGALTYQGEAIDLVYRRLVTMDLLEIYDEITPFIDAYYDNAFLCVGSLRSHLMHTKLIYKILRLKETKALLTEEECAFIDAHIPYTEELLTEEDVALLKGDKDNYILKPVEGYASQGVYPGKGMSQEAWEKVLDEIRETPYIYQKYVEMIKTDFVEFDEEGNLSVNGFSSVIGLFIYDEQFTGTYTRIGNDALISGARSYYTTPGILVE